MDTIIQALLSQGAVGIIAALALFLLDRSYKDRLKEVAETKETSRSDRTELIAVIRENAKTMTTLQITIETSQRTIEALLYEGTGTSSRKKSSDT